MKIKLKKLNDEVVLKFTRAEIDEFLRVEHDSLSARLIKDENGYVPTFLVRLREMNKEWAGKIREALNSA